jgi:hemerythrin-like domain-containing protein
MGDHSEIQARIRVPKTLNVIRDEHRSIAAILHGMEYFVDKIRARKAKVNPRVFAAMIYYLDTFSERMHHPKEDRYLFSAMRSRGKEAAAIVADLEQEHAAGGDTLRRLEQCLVRYEEGGDKEFPAFSQAVERFVREYRDHMHKEEDIVFPLAERLLSASDWEAIDRAFGENRDPLAAERDTRDFEKLFDRIVNLAPPPIGVGPEA